MHKRSSKKMKKAFIFDLDGVICFTDKYHYSAWKSLADKLNIPFDEKVNDRLRGVSRLASLEIILEKSTVEYTQEQKEAFTTEKNEKYRTLLNNMSPSDISDDVRDTLVGLKNKGFKLAIGSSSKTLRLSLKKRILPDISTQSRTEIRLRIPNRTPKFF